MTTPDIRTGEPMIDANIRLMRERDAARRECDDALALARAHAASAAERIDELARQRDHAERILVRLVRDVDPSSLTDAKFLLRDRGLL